MPGQDQPTEKRALLSSQNNTSTRSFSIWPESSFPGKEGHKKNNEVVPAIDEISQGEVAVTVGVQLIADAVHDAAHVPSHIGQNASDCGQCGGECHCHGCDVGSVNCNIL